MPLSSLELHKQQVGAKLVEREVIYCVSSLISSLGKILPEVPSKILYEESIDSEEVYDLYRGKADADDYREAYEYAAGARYIITVTEGDDGEWLWTHTGEDGEPNEGSADSELKAWQEAFRDGGYDEPEGAEIFEHWIISTWLASKLEARGHTIVRDFMGISAIWGRPTTGQAISMDYVIQQIALDLWPYEGKEGAA